MVEISFSIKLDCLLSNGSLGMSNLPSKRLEVILVRLQRRRDEHGTYLFHRQISHYLNATCTFL
jgi:hypothetical protein